LDNVYTLSFVFGIFQRDGIGLLFFLCIHLIRCYTRILMMRLTIEAQEYPIELAQLVIGFIFVNFLDWVLFGFLLKVQVNLSQVGTWSLSNFRVY
jgi:hypothetical protein